MRYPMDAVISEANARMFLRYAARRASRGFVNGFVAGGLLVLATVVWSLWLTK